MWSLNWSGRSNSKLYDRPMKSQVKQTWRSQLSFHCCLENSNPHATLGILLCLILYQQHGTRSAEEEKISLSPNLKWKLMYLSISSPRPRTSLAPHRYETVYWSSASFFCPAWYIICTSMVRLCVDANRQSLGASDLSRAALFGIISQALQLWVSSAEDGSLKELEHSSFNRIVN